jgi:predicted ArsR family transcriptional regulator
LSEIRRGILSEIKARGAASIADLAEVLAVSYEAVRLQIAQMRAEGWVEKRIVRSPSATVGRPHSRYRLTRTGEHLFPKFYDLLTVELIDSIIERFGIEGLRSLLADLVKRRVEDWEPRLRGLSLQGKLEALKGLYLADDPYTQVEIENGQARLIENNCPFLNVALERPALCSLSVATLSNLLDRKVIREESFQAGHGRYVFRLLDEAAPQEKGFQFESER